MRSHKELDTWQQAMQLVKLTYQVSASFPKTEQFGLTSQMRRAAVSVPSNIAEGVARGTTKEYAQFVSIARGSLSELDTQFEIAQMLGFIDSNDPVFPLLESVTRLLSGLHRSLKIKING